MRRSRSLSEVRVAVPLSSPGTPPTGSRDLVRQLQSYVQAFAGVARRQQLAPLERLGALRFYDAFTLHPRQVARWNALFGVPGREDRVPFTFHSAQCVDRFHTILRTAGVNFRNVLHLRSELRLPPGGQAYRAGGRYEMHSGFERFIAVGERSAVLTGAFEVWGERGVVVTGREHFFVKRLARRDRRLLPGPSQAEGDWRRSKDSLATLNPEASRSFWLHYPEDLGVLYGRVSGDMNIVHINKWLTRLFGLPRTFAQGLCTANYVLKTLVADDQRQVESLELDYCRPVFLGQTAQLRVGGGRFELVDRDNALLVRGAFT